MALRGVAVRHHLQKNFWFALLVAVAVPFGCGAPTKKASDVVGMFQREPQKIREVASGLCQQLADATEAPSLRSVKLTLAQCMAVDEKPQELSQSKELEFVKIDQKKFVSEQSNDPNPVLYVQTRGQVWLNHSMLRLTQKLIRAIRDAEANGTSAILPNMNASAAESDILRLSFTEIQKTTLDDSGTRLNSSIELTGRGAVTIQNVFVTEGRIFNDSIALEVNTREDSPFEKSILKRMNAVVLIIPFGDDVYVDMVVDLHINSFGADRLVAEQVTYALAVGIKAGLDALIKLD